MKLEYPCRVEGWLNVCEAECCIGEAANEACWEPCYCVLLQDEQTLTAYRSEDMALFAGTACMFKSHNKLGDAMFVELPRVRLDGGARAFRQHWGYETRPLAPPPPLIEEDEAAIEPETVSLREANTASPIGSFLAHRPSLHCTDDELMTTTVDWRGGPMPIENPPHPKSPRRRMR